MDTRLTETTIEGLLERLSSADPVPGGGSAAAMAGALGAGLLQMVVALTDGRPAAEGNRAELAEIRLTAASLQSELMRLVEVDAAAYASVVAARRLPRDTERASEARRVQVDAAVREATRAPLATARSADAVLALAERLAPIGNRHAVSDVGVAAVLATAAVRGAALNVRINLPSLAEDEPLRTEASAILDRLEADLDRRQRDLLATVGERIG